MIDVDDLPQRCDVHRGQQVSDGRGGYAETFAVRRRRVPCRMSGASAARVTPDLVGGMPQVEPASRVYFLPDADVRPFDRLVIDGVGYGVADSTRQADGAYRVATAIVIQGWPK